MKNNSYLYYCGLIICGGFAVLEYMEGNTRSALIWFTALALLMAVWALWKKRVQMENLVLPVPSSKLSLSQQQAMEAGKLGPLEPDGFQMGSKEICYWYDMARQDHYNAPWGTMYLTGQRVVFTSPDFSFAHPVKELKLKETRQGIEMEIRHRKMRFLTASTPALLGVWKQLKSRESR